MGIEEELNTEESKVVTPLEFFCMVAKEFYHEKQPIVPVRISEAGDGINARLRNLGFIQIKDEKYELYLEVPDFIMAKENKYYHFGKCDLGVLMRFQKGEAMIESPPRVINAPYAHPLVSSSGFLAFGDTSRWEYINVKFSDWRPLDEEFAWKTAAVMIEGKMLIERSYLSGNNLYPFTCIESYPPIATTRKNAECYAQAHNIPNHRVIVNG